MCRCTDPNKTFLGLQTNLVTCNAIVKVSIRNAKRMYFAKLFKKYQSDIKKTWSAINSILNRTTDNNTKGFSDGQNDNQYGGNS